MEEGPWFLVQQWGTRQRERDEHETNRSPSETFTGEATLRVHQRGLRDGRI
jgi:hypothetical protein